MKIAIVGATGEVGRMMIQVIEEFGLELSELDLFSSERSEGTILYFNDQPIKAKRLTETSLLKKYDYVLFSAGAGVSIANAPSAIESDNIVIDNSSAWRREPEIPLIVPEINGDLLAGYQGIIANPNCSTIQMVIPLAILHQAYVLKKVVVSTYQSVSGSGHKGIDILMRQRNGDPDTGIFPVMIDLNVIPQIGGFLDDGCCQEEDKMRFETRKILSAEDIEVCATTVRVPVIYGHSASVYAEFAENIDLAQAEQLLTGADSLVYYPNTYITPKEISNSNDSHVCRLRYGTGKNTLSFWNVGNNVRLGAATNAIRIMLKHAELNGLR